MVKHLKPRIWRSESSRCLMLDSPSLILWSWESSNIFKYRFLSKYCELNWNVEGKLLFGENQSSVQGNNLSNCCKTLCFTAFCLISNPSTCQFLKHLKPRIWRSESSKCLMLDSPSLIIWSLESNISKYTFLSKYDFDPN